MNLTTIDFQATQQATLRVKAFHYDDVALLPKFSNLQSRSKVDTSVSFSHMDFKLPVIPANMSCVINEDIASFCAANGYFYILHRFGNTFDFIANMQKSKFISISVGVKKHDHDFVKLVSGSGYRVDFITIDIAHGHSQLMKDMIECIKEYLPTTFIIAGNVCTPEGFDDLASWGAKIIKCGVGPGAACTTKLKTGFTYPMFSCIQNIKQYAKHYDKGPLLIADGGIKHTGDIAKALVAGADMVMCGKLFSECVDSPAPVINGKKVYYGSASSMNKVIHKNIEGTILEVENNGLTIAQKFEEIKQDLQSSISYAGGKDLSCLDSVRYIAV